MGNDIEYLTKEEFKAKEERLNYLKTVARIEVANKIEIARSFGDISENAEYDAAREEESLVEQEIIEIDNTLRTAKIIDKTTADEVSVGNSVTVVDEDDEEETYTITGSYGSDPLNGLISNQSPIGAALLGKKKGDIVEILLPNKKTIKYTIKNIK
jgi:transcription elongation factor GreA